MKTPEILVATWNDGLFVIAGRSAVSQELVGQQVQGLTADGQDCVLAIVNGRNLCRRSIHGQYQTIATSDTTLSAAVVTCGRTYIGTDDARIFRVRSSGKLEVLDGFDEVAGRDTWYAGTVQVNGKEIGPPLGIRSLTATANGEVLLANVHVGGIPRSMDGGMTWQPTIDIDADVHEVRAHRIILTWWQQQAR